MTVAEYQHFVAEGGYGKSEYWDPDGFGKFSEPDDWRDQLDGPWNRPVVGVSWFEAAAYCAWAEGRLPSEAEWEYAARADRDGVRYPWGNEDPKNDTGERRANYAYKDSPRLPTPVGLYPRGATPTGIYDLAGNVWEWVADDYPGEENTKILRGGCWSDDAWVLRVAYRNGNYRTVRNFDIGFRCVWESRSL